MRGKARFRGGVGFVVVVGVADERPNDGQRGQGLGGGQAVRVLGQHGGEEARALAVDGKEAEEEGRLLLWPSVVVGPGGVGGRGEEVAAGVLLVVGGVCEVRLCFVFG